MNLTVEQELYLENLEKYPTTKAAAEATGIHFGTAKRWNRELKDIIIDRARDTLAAGALRAAVTAVELLDADAMTEKGELRLAASEKIMDRVGLTKHTSVEVKVESENGVFILPGKTPVKAPVSDSEEE